VADLMAALAPEVRNLAMTARAFLFKTAPDITEQVDGKARMIGYSYGPKICRHGVVTMPTKTGGTLALPMPWSCRTLNLKTILEGTGKLHRPIKLKSKSDLENAALKSLLKAAIAAASTRPETTGQNAKN
jgi:hypothetical protein